MAVTAAILLVLAFIAMAYLAGRNAAAGKKK
jgi:hypothetical protein